MKDSPFIRHFGKMRPRVEIVRQLEELEGYTPKSVTVYSVIAALKWVLGEKIELI